jgi:tetratricopeptide (TPR) repeat protein
MTNNDNLNFETSDEPDGTDEQTRPKPYLHEPLYNELLKKYQNADWEGCSETIDSLLELYPEEPSLLEFQREVNVRQLLQTGTQNLEREEKRARNRTIFVRVLISVVVLAVLGFAIRFGINTYQNNLEQARLEREQANQAKLLGGYYENAESYMQSGRWVSAQTEYQKIFDIDPEYQNVAERLQEAKDMIALDTRYLEGVDLFDDGEILDALEVFKEVQTVVPNYRNTTQLINQIETIREIDRLFDEALQA